MPELKQIDQSELQVGKLYCDTPKLHGFNTVIMRYIGKIKGSHNFKYISGNSEYINEGDGIIRLAYYTKEPNWYWEVPKENADVIEEALAGNVFGLGEGYEALTCVSGSFCQTRVISWAV